MPGSFLTRERHSGFYQLMLEKDCDWERRDEKIYTPSSHSFSASASSPPTPSRSCVADGRASAWTFCLDEISHKFSSPSVSISQVDLCQEEHTDINHGKIQSPRSSQTEKNRRVPSRSQIELIKKNILCKVVGAKTRAKI